MVFLYRVTLGMEEGLEEKEEERRKKMGCFFFKKKKYYKKKKVLLFLPPINPPCVSFNVFPLEIAVTRPQKENICQMLFRALR